MEAIIGVLVGVGVSVMSFIAGIRIGRSSELETLKALSRQPIAGQIVNVRGIGDVMVIGRSKYELNDSRDQDVYIDYISCEVLAGRKIGELSEEELKSAASVPLWQFMSQCEFVRSQKLIE